MGMSPGSATVRVTAADAREAVERIEDELEQRTKHTGSGSEVSDIVPITMELEEIDEEIAEELEEFEELEEVSPIDDTPVPHSGMRQLPTAPSQPMETEAVGVLSSGGYTMSVPAGSSDSGMRLGAIVAMAGLAALVLGGLSALLVLGGGDEDESTPAVSAPADGAAGDDAATPADAGMVEVRAVEGARVEIDGEDRGEVPVSVELPLGEHRVKVTAIGYHPWQTTIDVKPGANAAVKAELVEAESDIEVVVESEAPPPPEPTTTKPKAVKRSKPKVSKPQTKSEGPKPKPKPKSDVFMDPSKKKDDGIFMPVGGK